MPGPEDVEDNEEEIFEEVEEDEEDDPEVDEAEGGVNEVETNARIEAELLDEVQPEVTRTRRNYSR